MRNFPIVSAIAVLFLFGCDASMTSSESQTQSLSEDANYKLKFVLPIDWTKSPITLMYLEIPESFKYALPVSESMKQNIKEFILKDESIDNWSQIITLAPFIGKGIQAEQFHRYLFKGLAADSSRFQEVNNKTYRIADNRISVVRAIADYTYNGKREMCLSYTVSGPLDAVNLQYTIVINDKMSPESAMKLFDNFIKNQTSIIHKE